MAFCTISNCVLADSGSSSFPSITFYSMQNYGFFADSTGFVGVTVAGSESVRFNSDLSVTFAGAVNFTGALTLSNGLNISTLGKTIGIKEGANAKMGTEVLVAGSATVSTTSVAANSRIFLSNILSGGTAGFLKVGTIVAGESFVITSSNGADTSTIAWVIIDPL